MWPYIPLVYLGVVKAALGCAAASVAAELCAAYSLLAWRGLVLGLLVSPLVAVLAILLVTLVAQVLHTPAQPAGTATRASYAAKVKTLEAQAGTAGALRMHKATVSNTFRPHQLNERGVSSGAQVLQAPPGRLDLSDFTHVLEVNTDELWCDLEASATFDTFTEGCLLHGCLPLVIPELRHITVGGAVVGIGIESSSFKHGFFHEGLIEADILLASGRVERIDANTMPDLFNTLPNSLGTFGYLTRVRMRIQRCKPFAKVARKNFFTRDDLIDGLYAACTPDKDFVDAVALSDTGGAVVTATFAASVPADAVRAPVPWSATQQFCRTLLTDGEYYMPIRDYVWRWDADWFWVSQIFPGSSYPVLRWLCGEKLMRSDVFKAFNDTFKPIADSYFGAPPMEHVVQDIVIPKKTIKEFVTRHIETTRAREAGKVKLTRPGGKELVPLWLCPVKGTATTLFPQDPKQVYINIGFWDAIEDARTTGGDKAGVVNKALEQACSELGALKTLYSTCYYSEEDLTRIYGDVSALKKKYDPQGRLRSMYERLARP